VRRYAQPATQPRENDEENPEEEALEKGHNGSRVGEEKEEGAFTRRMRDMSE
jgi:hypothetical protein